jgi:uncharacterized membrane protein
MRRGALPEHLRGSLWVLPCMFAVGALVLGWLLSLLPAPPGSALGFQGTADDARSLLIGITSTMVTVIALLLGLSVVALQLSSTQFSPRLLRTFLRDRPNQVVLGVFVGTFVYAAAGLFTVGVAGGERVEDFPRIAVSAAIVLLFLSLGALVFFADHLVHSIQVDAIMREVERNTLQVIRAAPPPQGDSQPVPAGGVALPAARSGYIQWIDVEALHADCRRNGISVQLARMVGEHVVAGSTLGWAWAVAEDTNNPIVEVCGRALRTHVRVGFERTFEQDVGFGLRQLVDVACKALSAAINDPYTAIQAIDHLAVLFAEFAARPLGDLVLGNSTSESRLAIPRRGFRQHLSLGVGLIRRYGAREPTVMQALLRLLHTCTSVCIEAPERWAVIEREAELIVAAAEAQVGQHADLDAVHDEAAAVRAAVADRRAGVAPKPDPAETTPL